MKILAVSDEVVERLYSLCNNGHFNDVELIIGCGDLPYPYLENILTLLNVPLLYVPGNHDPNYSLEDEKAHAEGGSNLDLKLACVKTFLIGGFGGCIQYHPHGTNQYTQTDAYFRAFRMLPRLLLIRINYGRSMDILITHSPPFGMATWVPQWSASRQMFWWWAVRGQAHGPPSKWRLRERRPSWPAKAFSGEAESRSWPPSPAVLRSAMRIRGIIRTFISRTRWSVESF